MQLVNEEKVSTNGFNLHVIQTKKYKTINVVVKFKAPLNRDTITQRALIPYVLQQGTKNNPSARSLRQKLDELYGAVLSIDSAKKGEDHIITVRMEVANEVYLSSNEQILENAVNVLNEIIFHPKSDGKAFDQKIINREKQTLLQKIDSIVDDKMSYANMRLIDEMCKDEAYNLHVHGYKEDLANVNEENLYEYYQSMLVEDELDIYILGDLEGKDVPQLITKNFSREVRTSKQQKSKGNVEVEKVNEITEQQDVQQGKLHLGFRTNIRFGDPEYNALQVFNGIFGGFPSSKLFMNVREKHSLAYYAASRFESHKGLLFVFSGIAPTDYQKAKEIIIEQMDAMRNGAFSDEQVDETKNMVINQLKETMDHPQGLVEVLYHQVLANQSFSPDKMIEEISHVSRDDLLKVGEKIQLDTVYFLTSKGGDADE
ncbi:insulinase family protein [Aquibacillus koreensis]|uniref:Insulinase family protein n=1 Tax=Aquibacillus koreensis TaxID=279446 RepID=A0A9X3WNF2_9BACI|nr:pitrilysin family protein [Aquibacillus koreensis]MCT2534588.1 insulinase family protein [Aquibacillus koreensis]MDC3421818.1 insulinase family protein [Aquibacillus koreensis]